MTKARDIADGTRYVDVTGDTMTGALTINASGNDQFRLTDGTQNLYLDTDSNGVAIAGGPGQTLGGVYLHNSVGNVSLFTNNALRMTVDTAGRVTMPYQPMFSAIRDAGSVSYNSEIVFNSVAVNVGGHYNASTGRFTAPVTGLYMFNIFGMSQSVGNVFWIQVRKNGAVYNKFNPYNEDNSSASNKYRHAGGSFIIQLNAGDYASGFTGNNSSITMYGTGNAHNGFSGYLIG